MVVMVAFRKRGRQVSERLQTQTLLMILFRRYFPPKYIIPFCIRACGGNTVAAF